MPDAIVVNVTTPSPRVVVVAVAGEIDVATVPDLEAVLTELVGDDIESLVVDLSETTFLDSTALGVLVGTEKHLRAAGRGFSVVCPSPQLRRIFEISRLDTVWSITASRSDSTHDGRPLR